MKSQRRMAIFLSLLLGCGLLTQKSQAFQKEKTVAVEVDVLKLFNSEFVEIRPGNGQFPKSFQMGSQTGPDDELPSHEVTLATPFFMAKHEVPQNLYSTVMGQNPSHWKGRRNSTEMMTYADAIKFCKIATSRMREAKLIGQDEEIRLPTESEWEYCCRAGTATAYSFGDKATAPEDQDTKASVLNVYAWHTGNAAGNDPAVGVLKANPWGLHDMHGYLWEFVADEWHDNYKNAPVDGSSWTSTKNDGPRVIRGGSWKDDFQKLRSSARRKIEVDEKGDEIGFRCVKAKAR
jgi:formylglycine-generating enzyme required for sulfatase activity